MDPLPNRAVNCEAGSKGLADVSSRFFCPPWVSGIRPFSVNFSHLGGVGKFSQQERIVEVPVTLILGEWRPREPWDEISLGTFAILLVLHRREARSYKLHSVPQPFFCQVMFWFYIGIDTAAAAAKRFEFLP